MKLVAGLGNPGRNYVGTRHNLGFDVMRILADRYAAASPRQKFDAEVLEVTIDGGPVLLMCPQTYMNQSGRSVRAARDFYKLDNHQVLIVCDDVNLPVAKLRCRARGSAGGHNGLKNLIQALNGEDFPRLRIGVGSPPASITQADFVLRRFGKQERREIDVTLAVAADAVEDWVRQGVEHCMNKYNAD